MHGSTAPWPECRARASTHTLATLRRPTFLYAPILRADRNVARSRLCVVPGTRSLSAWTRTRRLQRWRTRTGPVSAAHNCAKVNILELLFYLVRLSRLGRAPARHGPRPVSVCTNVPSSVISQELCVVAVATPGLLCHWSCGTEPSVAECLAATSKLQVTTSRGTQHHITPHQPKHLSPSELRMSTGSRSTCAWHGGARHRPVLDHTGLSGPCMQLCRAHSSLF